MECVSTVNYTVMINGESIPPFDAAKGLRQGDPISSFLFAIVMEYLSRSLNSLKEVKSFRFHPRCANLGITHLSYADDLLIQTASKSEEKLSVFWWSPQTVRRNILQQLGFTLGELPFKYLGIPLANKKLSLIQWHPLVEKIIAKISSWIAKKLSYTGRVQLVQTVLFGIQSYWSQLFTLPSKVLKMIDSYSRSYIWSGINVITKKPLVAWDKMCTPKSSGA
uniref:Reverse transcriptase domain-containing protein n=1 Tax=Nicotiana tabacum TaxID=4097 RepID=A0A1S4CWP9_TOBAC|nr:PREDICTED: uncharacterized protein LOC107823437 [Nicotiana tabacum]